MLLPTEPSHQPDFIYFNVYEYTVVVFRHQKRVSDHIADGGEPPCDCWELNSGPLEEQSVLLTSEPSLQPPCVSFDLILTLFLKCNNPSVILKSRIYFGGLHMLGTWEVVLLRGVME